MVFNIRFTLPMLLAMFGQFEETPDPQLTQETTGRPTLGGTQFWTDHLVCHGWRIQRNVQFGQFRLLKPTNRVAETGAYETCRRAFDAVCRQGDFPPIPSTVLVTVHGLGRSRNSMTAIGKHVSEKGNFGWINFEYASTRTKISEHARALRGALDELASLKRELDAAGKTNDGEPIDMEYHFVAHSLGNVVVRKMLWDIEQNKADRRGSAWQVGRMVMLGPPNQGSAMATLLGRSKAFDFIAGSSGKDLGTEWNELEVRLTVPNCEFAIIAGGKSDDKGYNPLLAGDDDLIVRVEETKLSGAADFAVIPSVHTVLMDRSESQKMALRFLQEGFLKTDDERKRIP